MRDLEDVDPGEAPKSHSCFVLSSLSMPSQAACLPSSQPPARSGGTQCCCGQLIPPPRRLRRLLECPRRRQGANGVPAGSSVSGRPGIALRRGQAKEEAASLCRRSPAGQGLPAPPSGPLGGSVRPGLGVGGRRRSAPTQAVGPSARPARRAQSTAQQVTQLPSRRSAALLAALALLSRLPGFWGG